MTAQLFLEGVSADGEARLRGCARRVQDSLAEAPCIPPAPGRGIPRREHVPPARRRAVRLDVRIDVRMPWARTRLNTAAELLRPLVEELSGGRVLMSSSATRP